MKKTINLEFEDGNYYLKYDKRDYVSATVRTHDLFL